MVNLTSLRQLMINDNGFAFDPTNGATYSISPTGLELIKWIKSGQQEDDLIDSLAEHYEVQPEVARRDCQGFIENLHRFGLLEREASP